MVLPVFIAAVTMITTFCLPSSTQDDGTLRTYDFTQRSVFQGQYSLFLDSSNYSFWINKDKTAFYVFTMADGLTPQAKWVRATRDSDSGIAISIACSIMLVL